MYLPGLAFRGESCSTGLHQNIFMGTARVVYMVPVDMEGPSATWTLGMPKNCRFAFLEAVDQS